MKKLIIILLLFLANSTFAQKEDKPFVGFFCGEELSYPEIATKYESLIKTKKYNRILKGLYSKNIAENFFSVIVAEMENPVKLTTYFRSKLTIVSG